MKFFEQAKQVQQHARQFYSATTLAVQAFHPISRGGAHIWIGITFGHGF
jgi:hypothetical protein